VNFDLSADERALRAGVRELCEKRFALEGVRTQGLTRDGWRALGEAGLFALRLSEDAGGVGLGMTESVVAYAEIGRGLVPGPLTSQSLAAGHLDGAASGERIVGLLEADREPLLVEHLDALDVLLVLDGDRTRIASPPMGTRVENPLDPLTPVHRIDGVPDGEPIDIARARLEGTVLTAALLAGNASRTTELAVAYAKEREQFGRPIGSFQAVKHLCADMLVGAEVARAATDAAGCLLDDEAADPTDVARAVAAAKLLASEAAVRNAKTCIQVHGGMGFTWGLDAHLFLKRALVLDVGIGSPDEALEALAAAL
jgi:alkylation response protein AidB-like acyl-CoA dehydrogenase